MTSSFHVGSACDHEGKQPALCGALVAERAGSAGRSQSISDLNLSLAHNPIISQGASVVLFLQQTQLLSEQAAE